MYYYNLYYFNMSQGPTDGENEVVLSNETVESDDIFSKVDYDAIIEETTKEVTYPDGRKVRTAPDMKKIRDLLSPEDVGKFQRSFVKYNKFGDYDENLDSSTENKLEMSTVGKEVLSEGSGQNKEEIKKEENLTPGGSEESSISGNNEIENIKKNRGDLLKERKRALKSQVREDDTESTIEKPSEEPSSNIKPEGEISEDSIDKQKIKEVLSNLGVGDSAGGSGEKTETPESPKRKYNNLIEALNNTEIKGTVTSTELLEMFGPYGLTGDELGHYVWPLAREFDVAQQGKIGSNFVSNPEEFKTILRMVTQETIPQYNSHTQRSQIQGVFRRLKGEIEKVMDVRRKRDLNTSQEDEDIGTTERIVPQKPRDADVHEEQGEKTKTRDLKEEEISTETIEEEEKGRLPEPVTNLTKEKVEKTISNKNEAKEVEEKETPKEKKVEVRKINIPEKTFESMRQLAKVNGLEGKPIPEFKTKGDVEAFLRGLGSVARMEEKAREGVIKRILDSIEIVPDKEAEKEAKKAQMPVVFTEASKRELLKYIPQDQLEERIKDIKFRGQLQELLDGLRNSDGTELDRKQKAPVFLALEPKGKKTEENTSDKSPEPTKASSEPITTTPETTKEGDNTTLDLNAEESKEEEKEKEPQFPMIERGQAREIIDKIRDFLGEKAPTTPLDKDGWKKEIGRLSGNFEKATMTFFAKVFQEAGNKTVPQEYLSGDILPGKELKDYVDVLDKLSELQEEEMMNRNPNFSDVVSAVKDLSEGFKIQLSEYIERAFKS